jgi:hypothetical protein
MLMEQREPHVSNSDKELVPARQRRVFLAEDDAEMRAILRVALTRRGYRVTEAASGTEALELLGDLLLGLARDASRGQRRRSRRRRRGRARKLFRHHR